MLSKTRGIVLHQIKYSDTSIIVYIYTEKYGRQTYLIKGAKRKNAKIKANIFQPLFLFDLEVYHNPNKKFQKIKEVVINPVLNTVPNNIIKKSISLFIAEVLYKIIKEEEPNITLFEYIRHHNTIISYYRSFKKFVLSMIYDPQLFQINRILFASFFHRIYK